MKHPGFLAALALSVSLQAFAHGGHEHSPPAEARNKGNPMWAGMQAPGLAVSTAFDPAGGLWRVRSEKGHLLVDRSEDGAGHFGEAVKVNRAPERIAADGEARPDIAIGPKGQVYVAWTTPLPAPYSGNVRFARSLDGGKTFSEPLTVNDDRQEITHRFQSLFVTPDGRVMLAWIDKREGVAAKKAGQAFRGASIWYAVSNDGGASFQPNRPHALHSCECCRLALAADRDGEPLLFWRHVFPDGTRDHALARLGAPAGREDIPRATAEHWKIDACPHHGPALAAGPDGSRHLAWFSVVNGEGRLLRQTVLADGTPLAAPVAFGGDQAGHPALLVAGQSVWLAWKEFDGKETRIGLLHSADGGRTWTSRPAPATAAGTSDNPQLLARAGRAFLSWNTAKEGYRLVALEGAK